MFGHQNDVIGHYYFNRNVIDYLNKRPPFNVCKEAVISLIRGKVACHKVSYVSYTHQSKLS